MSFPYPYRGNPSGNSDAARIQSLMESLQQGRLNPSQVRCAQALVEKLKQRTAKPRDPSPPPSPAAMPLLKDKVVSLIEKIRQGDVRSEQLQEMQGFIKELKHQQQPAPSMNTNIKETIAGLLEKLRSGRLNSQEILGIQRQIEELKQQQLQSAPPPQPNEAEAKVEHLLSLVRQGKVSPNELPNILRQVKELKQAENAKAAAFKQQEQHPRQSAAEQETATLDSSLKGKMENLLSMLRSGKLGPGEIAEVQRQVEELKRLQASKKGQDGNEAVAQSREFPPESSIKEKIERMVELLRGGKLGPSEMMNIQREIAELKELQRKQQEMKMEEGAPPKTMTPAQLKERIQELVGALKSGRLSSNEITAMQKEIEQLKQMQVTEVKEAPSSAQQDIQQKIGELVTRAREGKLGFDEMTDIQKKIEQLKQLQAQQKGAESKPPPVLNTRERIEQLAAMLRQGNLTPAQLADVQKEIGELKRVQEEEKRAASVDVKEPPKMSTAEVQARMEQLAARLRRGNLQPHELLSIQKEVEELKRTQTEESKPKPVTNEEIKHRIGQLLDTIRNGNLQPGQMADVQREIEELRAQYTSNEGKAEGPPKEDPPTLDMPKKAFEENNDNCWIPGGRDRRPTPPKRDENKFASSRSSKRHHSPSPVGIPRRRVSPANKPKGDIEVISLSSSSSKSRSRSPAPQRRRTNSKDKPAAPALILRNISEEYSTASIKSGLYHLFKKYGQVGPVLVLGRGDDRRAIVYFEDYRDVKSALRSSEGKTFLSRPLHARIYDGKDPEEQQEASVAKEPSVEKEARIKECHVLFVGNIDEDVEERDLRKHFSKIGPVLDINLKSQGFSRFAFIEFPDIATTVRASDRMSGARISRNRLKTGFGKSVPTSIVLLEGVPDSMSKDRLTDLCERYGKVSLVSVDREVGQALVFYDKLAGAEEAVERLHNMEINGWTVKVDFASRQCQEQFAMELEESQRRLQGLRNGKVPRYELLENPIRRKFYEVELGLGESKKREKDALKREQDWPRRSEFDRYPYPGSDALARPVYYADHRSLLPEEMDSLRSHIARQTVLPGIGDPFSPVPALPLAVQSLPIDIARPLVGFPAAAAVPTPAPQAAPPAQNEEVQKFLLELARLVDTPLQLHQLQEFETVLKDLLLSPLSAAHQTLADLLISKVQAKIGHLRQPVSASAVASSTPTTGWPQGMGPNRTAAGAPAQLPDTRLQLAPLPQEGPKTYKYEDGEGAGVTDEEMAVAAAQNNPYALEVLKAHEELERLEETAPSSYYHQHQQTLARNAVKNYLRYGRRVKKEIDAKMEQLQKRHQIRERRLLELQEQLKRDPHNHEVRLKIEELKNQFLSRIGDDPSPGKGPPEEAMKTRAQVREKRIQELEDQLRFEPRNAQLIAKLEALKHGGGDLPSPVPDSGPSPQELPPAKNNVPLMQNIERKQNMIRSELSRLVQERPSPNVRAMISTLRVLNECYINQLDVLRNTSDSNELDSVVPHLEKLYEAADRLEIFERELIDRPTDYKKFQNMKHQGGALANEVQLFSSKLSALGERIMLLQKETQGTPNVNVRVVEQVRFYASILNQSRDVQESYHVVCEQVRSKGFTPQNNQGIGRPQMPPPGQRPMAAPGQRPFAPPGQQFHRIPGPRFR